MIINNLVTTLYSKRLLSSDHKSRIEQGGVTLVASVLPSATAVKVEVKSQAYKSQQVKGQAVLVKVEKVNSQRARQIPQSILT